MLRLYLNYPNSRTIVHHRLSCPHIPDLRSVRHVNVDAATASSALARFEDHVFKSKAAYNDMWVTVNMATVIEDMAIVDSIKRTLSRRYAPFRAAMVRRCDTCSLD